MDLRQSPEYAKYLEFLSWQVEEINEGQIFIKQFPLIGSIIKVQRPEKVPEVEKTMSLIKKYRPLQIIFEPSEQISKKTSQSWEKAGFKQSRSPYLSTKTIHIDLTQSEEKIFANFSSAKRRAIRKAIKNEVIISQGKDIESLITLKNAQNGFLGHFLRIDKQFRALWQAFRPQKASLLLAFSDARHPELVSGSRGIPNQVRNDVLLAGVLLLFHDKIAYYYQAASTKQGNQLAAPSLLVWEALKIAKKKGSKVFDFEGIYDPRFPRKAWHGFTKFKMGFGGEIKEYPAMMTKINFPFLGFFSREQQDR